MNRRTQILLGGLILVGLIMLVDQAGLLTFLDDFGSQHAKALAKVKKQLQVADDLILKGTVAADQLAALEARSLPFDSELARSQYQDWLSSIVKQNELGQSSVEVGLPMAVPIAGEKKQAYTRYSFSVNGSGTLEQVTRFLFDYYQGPHLQKLNTVRVNPAGRGLYALSVSGETLCVATCDRKSELSSLPPYRLQQNQFADYEPIVRRNMFSRESGTTLKTVRLTSVTFDKQGLPEAWFKIGPTKTTRKLQRGESLTVTAHHIEVIDIQPKSALLEVDEDVVLLPIGKTVHEKLGTSH